MSQSANEPIVASNASTAIGTGIPGMILYPSLGAPTFVSPKGFLHFLFLSKEELVEAEVNRRLQIHAEFSSLLKLKTPGASVAASLETVVEEVPPMELCFDPSGIEINPITKPNGLIEIADIGLRGYLNHKTLGFWKDETSFDDQMGFLHHISVDLSKLNDGYVEAAQGQRFFLHWSDFGGSSKPRPYEQQSQEDALYQVLQKANDGILMGKRLWKDLDSQRIPVGKGSIPCLDPDGLVPDKSVPLTDIHPVYRRPRAWIPDPARSTGATGSGAYIRTENPKEALSLAVISDLHLVTKFQVLQHSPMRVIPSTNGTFRARAGLSADQATKELADLFPSIGKLMSESVQVLGSHFRNVAEDSSLEAPEAILLVGDLIDFHRECYPTGVREVFTRKEGESELAHAKRIWDKVRTPSEFDPSGTKDADLERNFQHGASYLGIFHLVAEFVIKSSRPVVMMAGNHDGYIEPFGISPRVAFDEKPEAKEFRKANEGIACDSNMTFLEATLCFGPSYGNHLMDKDFDKRVMDLFFLLFSPFRTWSMDMGTKQPTIFLDWGDSEMMFMHAEDDKGSAQAGHLPHADLAVIPRDVELVQKIASESAGKCLTLVSHFTYACYEPKVPLVTGCNQKVPKGPENEKSFHDDDVQSQAADTAEGTVTGVVLGALGGAAAGAAVGALGGLAVAAATGKDAGETAKQGAVGGAIVGGLAGAALGGGALGYFSNYAGLNNMLNKHRLPNDYNYGTFHTGRKPIFDLISKGSNLGISMTISGHAHRAAFYTHEGLRTWMEEPAREEEPPIERTEIKVRGWHFEEFRRSRESLENKCLMVVSDSAGPIPRRNKDNVLEGWGSQRPSWTKIVFIEGVKPCSIDSVFTSFENAKPRLAVALDYLEGTVTRCNAKFSPSDSGGILKNTYWNKFKNWIGGDKSVPMREISGTQFPQSLDDGGDKPLWRTTPAALATDANRENEQKWSEAHNVAILPDKLAGTVLQQGETEESFSSNILSAFVSERIDLESFKANPAGIRLWHNRRSILLPPGYSIQGADVLFQAPDANGWLKFQLDPLVGEPTASVGGWSLKEHVEGSQAWSAWLVNAVKLKVSLQFSAWLRYRLTSAGKEGEYTTDSPWIVKCNLGIYPIGGASGKRSRLVLYRDIWGNERPDHAAY